MMIHPPSELGLTDLVPLSGGVASLGVWRGSLDGRAVVFKWADEREVIVLDLLAELDDPLFPTVIDHGTGEHGPWLITDFHTGDDCGLVGTLPPQVHRSMGRLHAHFSGRDLPTVIPRHDVTMVRGGLDDFARAVCARQRTCFPTRLGVR